MSTISHNIGKQLVKESNWIPGWDYIDAGLSAIGMVPGLGILSNGASALGNLAQGNWTGAGLAGAGMIPGVGIMSGASKLGKLGLAGVRATKGIGQLASHVPGVANMASRAMPAIHALQPYNHVFNAANRYGNFAQALTGSNHQNYSAPFVPPMAQSQNSMGPQPIAQNYPNMFNQPMNSYRPQSFYGNV